MCNKSLGTAAVLAASLCFSTGGLLMKIIPWNPLAINGVRNVIAAVVIGLYILALRHKLKFNFTVLVGAISMAGVTTLFSIANKLTTAGNTIILQYTAPIWIVILMFLIFNGTDFDFYRSDRYPVLLLRWPLHGQMARRPLCSPIRHFLCGSLYAEQL